MFRKVFINTASQILGKITTASITFLITILIGRTLGEVGYGEFTKIFVFVGYFYTLADFGLNSIYIQLATSKEQERIYLKALYGLRILISIMFAVLAILIAFLVPHNEITGTGFSKEVKIGIIIASLTIVTQAILTTSNAYFQKNLKYYLSTFAVSLSALATLVGAVLVTIIKGGVLAYAAVYLVAGLILAISAYLFVTNNLKSVLPIFSKTISKKFLSGSWPIGVALIFNLVYFRIDVFILSSVRPPHEVGIYGLAYQFFEASLTVPMFFANALYPLLTNIYLKNKADFIPKVKIWLVLLLLASLMLSSFLFIIAYFIPFIYSGNFRGSTQVLQILSTGIPFFFLSAILWHVLIIYKKQKALIPIYGLGALFNLSTNIALIPKIGYVAAAGITVVSEALITLMLFFAVIFYTRKMKND